MHHERIGPSPRQPFGSEAIEHVIFARGGDECAIHPFMLKAQHHHYISAFQPFVEISESSRTHLLYGFRSEEHTYELQSLMRISYAVFCLKKNKKPHITEY